MLDKLNKTYYYLFYKEFVASSYFRECFSGADHFDHTLPPHCHLYCRCCGEVTDVAVDQAALEQIFSEVPARIESFSVTLIGVCLACMAQNAEPAQFE